MTTSNQFHEMVQAAVQRKLAEAAEQEADRIVRAHLNGSAAPPGAQLPLPSPAIPAPRSGRQQMAPQGSVLALGTNPTRAIPSHTAAGFTLEICREILAAGPAPRADIHAVVQERAGDRPRNHVSSWISQLLRTGHLVVHPTPPPYRSGTRRNYPPAGQ